jgi:hypothetical protein
VIVVPLVTFVYFQSRLMPQIGWSDNSFLVIKGFSSTGPTWTTTRFKVPGPFADLSRVNTDKISLAFAQGPNLGKPMPPLTETRAANPPNQSANFLLQQLLTSSITNQPQILQNSIVP